MNMQETNVRNPNEPNVTGAQANPQIPQYHYVYGIPVNPWASMPYTPLYQIPYSWGWPSTFQTTPVNRGAFDHWAQASIPYGYTDPRIPYPHSWNIPYTQANYWQTPALQYPYTNYATPWTSYADPYRTVNPQNISNQPISSYSQPGNVNPGFYGYPLAPHLFNWTGWNPMQTYDPMNQTRIPIT